MVSTSTDCPPASTGWQPPSTALGPTPASASLGGGPSVGPPLVVIISVSLPEQDIDTRSQTPENQRQRWAPYLWGTLGSLLSAVLLVTIRNL